jgi:hypothetical protein
MYHIASDFFHRELSLLNTCWSWGLLAVYPAVLGVCVEHVCPCAFLQRAFFLPVPLLSPAAIFLRTRYLLVVPPLRTRTIFAVTR